VYAFSRRAERIAKEHGRRLQQFWVDAGDAYGRIAAAAKDGRLAGDAKAYATDSTDAAHDAAGADLRLRRDP
jgi:hypothetical protein